MVGTRIVGTHWKHTLLTASGFRIKLDEIVYIVFRRMTSGEMQGDSYFLIFCRDLKSIYFLDAFDNIKTWLGPD